MDKATAKQARVALTTYVSALREKQTLLEDDNDHLMSVLNTVKLPMQSRKGPFWHVGGLKDGDARADMFAALKKAIIEAQAAEKELERAETATEAVEEIRSLLQTK